MHARNDSIPRDEFVKLMVSLKIAEEVADAHDDHPLHRRKRDLSNLIGSTSSLRVKRATTSTTASNQVFFLAL